MSFIKNFLEGRATETKKIIEDKEKNAKGDEELFPLIYPTHSKDAIFLRVDYDAMGRILSFSRIPCANMTSYLVPILSALGLLTKKNLFKFGNLDGWELKDAIKKEFISNGGTAFLFDEFAKKEEFRRKFQKCGTPELRFYSCVNIEEVPKDKRELYWSDYRVTFDDSKLEPFFEVWIENEEELKKYKLHNKIISLMNEFFEDGTNPELLMKYFGSVDRDTGKVVFDPHIFKKNFVYSGTFKNKQ